MRMPYRGAHELIERLRARTATLKVLAFSGYSGTAVEGIEVLAKPVHARGVADRRRRCTRGGVGAAEASSRRSWLAGAPGYGLVQWIGRFGNTWEQLAFHRFDRRAV